MLFENKNNLVKLFFIALLLLFLISNFNSVFAEDLSNSALNDSNSYNENIILDENYNSYSSYNYCNYYNNYNNLGGSNDLNSKNILNYNDLESSDSLSSLESSNISSENSSNDTSDNSSNTSSNNSSNSTVSKINTVLTTKNLNTSYASSYFTVKLSDSNGNPIVGAIIKLTVSSKTYNKTTDSEGKANLKINLKPGSYKIFSKFLGNQSYYASSEKTNTIIVTKKKLTLTSVNLNKKYGSSDKFQVKITDNGSLVSNIPVAITVSSKTYIKYTNAKGITSLNINLKIGKYSIKSVINTNKYYYSSSFTNDITVSSQNPYKLTVLKWGSNGNLNKNTVLMKNIQKTVLSNAIIAASKNGTCLLQFGNGSGKKAFIVAGVHGNELSSMAATFKLVNSIYNSKTKLNGTLYIIPVLSPKNAVTSTRYYNGVNLNGVANKAGTLSNKLVNYAKSLKVDVVGDFHCTRPGGDPGKNVAMGTYSPNDESATLAKYISKTTGYSCLIYNKAGVEYPGAVEDVLNLAGITSVTCEVVTPHGTIKSGSVAKSYNMMNAILKYYKII